MIDRAARIGRLVYAEILKIASHPFFYISYALLILIILAWIWLYPRMSPSEKSDYRNPNAIQLFTYGYKVGLKVATFIALIFASMMFAGEFDRGTIKNLLTRPITRTDFYAAKVLTTLLLTLFLVGTAVYVSLLAGARMGELGHLWDKEVYAVNANQMYDRLEAHAVKAVLWTILPTIAAAALGLLISAYMESSGYAVATALILYIVIDLAVGFAGAKTGRYFFNYYPGYALDTLRAFAEGAGDARWLAEAEQGRLPMFARVPLITAAAGMALSYPWICRKDIKA